jgi:hypothetical protein
MSAIIPTTTHEKFLYNTVKITTETGCGTGFFYSINISENQQFHLLVTNKHVIKDSKTINLKMHISTNHEYQPSGTIADIEFRFQESDWLMHKNADLCACNFSIIANKYKEETKQKLYYLAIDKNIIPSKDEWECMSVGEQVFMVGYPRGISDETNNYPLLRSGIFSSPPSQDFNGQREFMVDMACFNGSSGSPVFYIRPHQYIDKKSKAMLITSGQKLSFIGILYAGPVMQKDGQIVFQNSIRIQTDLMINLGNVIRSDCMLDIESQLLSLIPNTN